MGSLTNVSLPLWTKIVFLGLANVIGRFVSIGDNMIHAMDKWIAAVLVELDVSQGPPTKIDIVWG